MLSNSMSVARSPEAAADPSAISLQNANPRIFLLEDNDLNAMVLKEHFRTFGLRSIVHVRTLADARSWMTDVLSGQFDLIIADVLLPDGMSLPLLERLVAEAPTPVALYTAKLMHEDREAYARLGVAHVFEKPVTTQKIRVGLAALLGA